MFQIREMVETDCTDIVWAFKEQGWHKPVQQYRQYLHNRAQGLQSLPVALINNEFAGYLTIQWQSDYRFFNEEGIPEITDLNVLKKYQQRGIATQLLDHAEASIFKNFETAGIGVGLTQDYGSAQRLYIKRGYVPDGNGLIQNNHAVAHGQSIVADDALVLYFTKTRPAAFTQ